MAELVDASDLKSLGVTRPGSSPGVPTTVRGTVAGLVQWNSQSEAWRLEGATWSRVVTVIGQGLPGAQPSLSN